MPTHLLENGMIRDDFTIERDGRRFTDALVMPAKDHSDMSLEQIEALKETRFANWLAHVVAMENRPHVEEIVPVPNETVPLVEE